MTAKASIVRYFIDMSRLKDGLDQNVFESLDYAIVDMVEEFNQSSILM